MVIHNSPILVSFSIWDLSKKIQKELDSTLGHFDLTYVQFLLLQTIYLLQKDKKFVTQQDLVVKLHADKNTISQCLKLLQHKKYLKRTTHPFDARAKMLLLTELGNKRLLQTQKLISLKDYKFYNRNIDDQQSLISIIQNLNV